MDWVNAMAKVTNKVKFQLFGRAYENLLHLYANIPKYDPGKHGGLSDHAFNLLLNASGIFLTTQELRVIRDQFPHELGVNYMLFISSVRNDLSQKRLAAIDHTFCQFEQDGRASLELLFKSVSAERHPHVRSMSKKGEKAQFDIEEGLKYWSADGTCLTYEEFSEFCKDVNATVPLEREEFFIDLLIHTFGLFDHSVSLERILQIEVTVFEKVRQRTQIRKDEGLKASSVFKFLDLEEKGVMDYRTFVGVLDRVGCKFSDKECRAVFFKHSGGSSLLGYEALCGLFFQMGSGNKDNTNMSFELARSG